METKYETGFVLGKFCPPHKGHEFLIDYAVERCERLYVVVDNIMDEVIPVKQRMEWIGLTYPQATVLTQPHPLPQYPEEADDFWQQWHDCLTALLPESIDAVFASETYGERLAQELGATFCPVDIARVNVPICSTVIRNDWISNWDFLADAAKRDLCVKVCLVGPESTGKSTLTARLGRHYDASVVDEYAKTVIERRGGDIRFEDMTEVVEGHQAAIEAALRHPRPYVIIDTDAIMSKIWSRELFAQDLPGVDDYIARQHFDLYLLLDIDLPWQDDIHRYRPDNRREFFDTCVRELELYHRPYVVISGSGDQRLQNAIRAIDLNTGLRRSRG